MRSSDEAFIDMPLHGLRCTLAVELLDGNLWALLVKIAQDQFVPREAVSKEGCLTYQKNQKKSSGENFFFRFW